MFLGFAENVILCTVVSCTVAHLPLCQKSNEIGCVESCARHLLQEGHTEQSSGKASIDDCHRREKGSGFCEV